MYEYSTVPEFLPGGGGFGIKNYSLEALYSEHRYARNIWTKPNVDLPLCRYLGCKMILYQSAITDYVFSYCNTLPLESNLGMYNSMQPSIHNMIKNSILVPSKKTLPKKKPYIKIHISPPTQLLNKWYFAQDLAKTPLVMTRASAISIDNYYIDPHSVSTNITIPHLNAGLIKNRNFKKPPTSGYWANTNPSLGKIYLYSTTQEVTNINDLHVKHLIFLGKSNINEPGESAAQANVNNASTWKTQNYQHWGNPFHRNYLTTDDRVWQTHITYPTFISEWESKGDNAKCHDMTEVFLVDYLRYNPYADQGIHNNCYFLSCAKEEEGWGPPQNPELTNEFLPLWLLIWGFADFHRKLKKMQHLDDDWLLVINTDATTPPRNPLVVLNSTFIEGQSPHEPHPNKQDYNIWYPSLQMQEITVNNIALCGPGTPKIPKDTDIEAKIKYYFYFKWGGHQPPMSAIEDPKNQTTYPIPRQLFDTNSLQNPATAPESLLFSFDERRGQITKKAIKRLQRDWETQTAFVSDGTSPFSETAQGQHQTTPEESSSEEEEAETLFEKLQQQRLKQRRLKQRILMTLQSLQNLE